MFGTRQAILMFGTRQAILAAAVLLPLLLGAARPRLSAAGPTAGGPLNVRVSHDQYTAHREPYLAVNPRDPRNLLGATQCIDVAAGFHPIPCTFVSFDGGQTWRDNGTLPLPPGIVSGADVTVAFTPQGIGLVASSGFDASGTPDTVLTWRSTDGGRSFAAPVMVYHGQGADHPWLAADPGPGPYAGRLYVAWTVGPHQGLPLRDPQHSRLLFSRSVDSGRSFSAPTTIAQFANGFPGTPALAVGPAGTVHVVFLEGLGTGQRTATILRAVVNSSDGGGHFGPPHPIAAEPGNLYLAQLTPTPVQSNLPTIAADRQNGTLYMAAAAYRSDSAHTDILLWRSADGGRTWAAPVRVNDDPLTDSIDHFQPQLLVTAQGTLYVSYFMLAHGRVSVSLTRSLDRGVSFAPSLRISTASFDPARGAPPFVGGGSWLGDYQGLAGAAGMVYPFWNDARTGHLEIFTAALAEGTPGT